jgi:hypothetical protein
LTPTGFGAIILLEIARKVNSENLNRAQRVSRLLERFLSLRDYPCSVLIRCQLARSRQSATERKVRKQLAKGMGIKQLAKGMGILKVAKSLGIGTGTVQRISNELGCACGRCDPPVGGAFGF